MKLEVKPEYEGLEMSITLPNGILLTFNSEVNNKSDYPFYYKNGFSHIFQSATKSSIKKIKKYIGIQHPKQNGEEETN